MNEQQVREIGLGIIYQNIYNNRARIIYNMALRQSCEITSENQARRKFVANSLDPPPRMRVLLDHRV